MGAASDQLNATVYTAADYALLGVVILSTVLLLITLISLISCFAKTIKEAQTAVVPLMILVMFIGVTAMFGNGAKQELPYYFIPLYNSVQCMIGIFSFDLQPSLYPGLGFQQSDLYRPGHFPAHQKCSAANGLCLPSNVWYG